MNVYRKGNENTNMKRSQPHHNTKINKYNFIEMTCFCLVTSQRSKRAANTLLVNSTGERHLTLWGPAE